MAVVHQNDLQQWCPNKYIHNTCRKSNLVMAFEFDPPKMKNLNPACCKCAKQYYLWPFYIVGICSLFLTLTLFAFMATAFYLSEGAKG